MIQTLIDQLLAWSAQALGDDIVVAKKEYFSHVGGEVHEHDRTFEARMQGFFNWYLFDRRTASDRGAQTPAQRFLAERGAGLFGSDKDLLICPPKGPRWNAPQLSKLSHFINCHGAASSPTFYGQPDGREVYPDAHLAPG